MTEKSALKVRFVAIIHEDEKQSRIAEKTKTSLQTDSVVDRFAWSIGVYVREEAVVRIRPMSDANGSTASV